MNRVAGVKESLQETLMSSSEQPWPQRRLKRKPLLDRETTVDALKQAFIMLRPDTQWKNPVMFVVEVGAFLTLLYILEVAWAEKRARCRSAISFGLMHGFS